MIFKFISPAYKHTFITVVNHIICSMDCLQQTGNAVILILRFFFHFLKCKIIEYHKNARKFMFNRCGMLMQIVLVKLT